MTLASAKVRCIEGDQTELRMESSSPSARRRRHAPGPPPTSGIREARPAQLCLELVNRRMTGPCSAAFWPTPVAPGSKRRTQRRLIRLKAGARLLAFATEMNEGGHGGRESPPRRTWSWSATAILLSASAAALANSASASPASVERGRRLAETHCKTCHTITGHKPSPVMGAPPFAEIQASVRGRSLDEIFAGAMASGHPPMPSFLGSPEQRQDLLDYIRSLQVTAPAR